MTDPEEHEFCLVQYC
ncbi:hypothetical protein [Streptomyces sp. BP-8]